MLLEGHSTRSCCRTSRLRLSVTAGTRNVLTLREGEMWAWAGEREPGRRRGQGSPLGAQQLGQVVSEQHGAQVAGRHAAGAPQGRTVQHHRCLWAG